jgi:ACR3 family arsenite efflux pump ArsB
MTNKRSFFRETNIYRIAGFALLVIGQFAPTTGVDLMGFKIEETNLMQVTGLLLLIIPMLREVAAKYLSRRPPQ